MAPLAAIPLFFASLAITLVAAGLFARRLDRLGVRFGFPEALIGLLTALAADGPEISSALFALAKGANNVGVGVVVGSNAFNLAAMIGVSGVLAGGVLLPRETLWLEGLIGVVITLIAGSVLLQWLAAPIGAALAACLLVPYLALLIAGPRLLARSRVGALRPLAHALEQRPGPEPARLGSSSPTHHLLGLVVLDVAVIIAGSAGMVQAALALADHWHVSPSVLGVLLLGPLTSIPNAITGVRLGLAGRSAALVGETFNSNTINLTAGVLAPALFITLGALTATVKLQLGWLAGMTAICIALLARPGGMRRRGAGALIGLYLGFAAIELLSS